MSSLDLDNKQSFITDDRLKTFTYIDRHSSCVNPFHLTMIMMY